MSRYLILITAHFPPSGWVVLQDRGILQRRNLQKKDGYSMRSDGKELRLTQRTEVSTLSIIGGLLVLLMLAVVACNSTEPRPTGTLEPGATSTSPIAPTLTSTPTATDTGSSLATRSDTPTPTPTATVPPTGTPTPTATVPPTGTPTPAPLPTPTNEEIAVEYLSHAISWFSNPPDTVHSDAAEAITAIWLMDASLGDEVARMPWVIDGVNDEESRVFVHLSKVGVEEPEFLRLLLGSPWVIDGVNDVEWEAFQLLVAISRDHKDLAMLVANVPLEEDEEVLQTVELLVEIGAADFELARRIAAVPWVADGVREEERRLLAMVLVGSDSSPELVEFLLGGLLEISSHLPGNLRDYLVDSLSYLAIESPQVLDRLRAQPWFQDGIDEEEAAFLVVLTGKAQDSPELFDDLLDAHFTQFTTVSLPLSGEVRLWIVQNTPFSPDKDLLTILADSVRFSEELMKVAFPTNDVILVVVDPGDKSYGLRGGAFLRTHMQIVGFRLGPMYGIPHETGHYYVAGPRWFSEGTSELVRAYVNHKKGIQTLDDRRVELESEARCSQYENIRHYKFIIEELGPIVGEKCQYIMGERFLLNMVEVIGLDAVSSAMRELELMKRNLGQRIREQSIYQTFLEATPTDSKEEFRDMYRLLHGGPYADPDIDLADDHGDVAGAASPVTMENAIEGTLDYGFDFDYFRFHADEGQKYQINVEHETLGESSIALYGPDGITPDVVGWKSQKRVATGPQIFWVAPTSDAYYLAVQNFGGESGTYTLTITPIIPLADDHGDRVATASSITVDGTYTGAVDDDFDLDYFRFYAEDDQRFYFQIQGETLENFRVGLYTSDGLSPARMDQDDIAYLEGGGSQVIDPLDLGRTIWRDRVFFDWMAPSAGDYYLVVSSAHGSLGTYILEMTAVASRSQRP